LVVSLLLEKGANLEATDTEYGQTPLSWAARNGHEVVASLLLERGANRTGSPVLHTLWSYVLA
jgi:ankyrin repeat protein